MRLQVKWVGMTWLDIDKINRLPSTSLCARPIRRRSKVSESFAVIRKPKARYASSGPWDRIDKRLRARSERPLARYHATDYGPGTVIPV
jgi:hypothetical protein